MKSNTLLNVWLWHSVTNRLFVTCANWYKSFVLANKALNNEIKFESHNNKMHHNVWPMQILPDAVRLRHDIPLNATWLNTGECINKTTIKHSDSSKMSIELFAKCWSFMRQANVGILHIKCYRLWLFECIKAHRFRRILIKKKILRNRACIKVCEIRLSFSS